MAEVDAQPTTDEQPLSPEEARDLAEEMLLIRAAALDLYQAGRWYLDRPAVGRPSLSLADQALLWEHLRDALGLPLGTATEAGAGSFARKGPE
jgi:hypothetical protein